MYVPKPDIIFRPSLDAESVKNKEAGKIFKLKTAGVPPAITDIEMRLKKVFIINNQNWFGGGNICIFTVVTDNFAEKPFILEAKTFNDIGKKEALPLGPAGLTIYRNPKGHIPRFLDFRIMVAKSDQELRDTGEILGEIKNSEEFKAAKEGLTSAAAAAIQPTVPLIILSADLIVEAAAKVLKMNRDDQIIYIAGSFNDKIDNLGTKYGPTTNKNASGEVTYEVLAV